MIVVYILKPLESKVFSANLVERKIIKNVWSMAGTKTGRGHGTSKNFEKEKNNLQMLYTKLQ